MVQATAEYAEARPDDFRGVRLVDGFRNTVPWPAASTEPARVGALSFHPYKGRTTFPGDEPRGPAINALFREDKSGFTPAYSANFPEYFGTVIQTESAVRDLAPITMEVNGTKHGRNARVIDGKVVPCPLWFTETGFAPREDGITDRDAALRIKAKTAARYLCFYPHKGLERIYFYSSAAGDTWLGVVQDNFIEYAKSNAAYPADDASYVSPMLRTLSRLTAKMREGVDPKLTRTRALTVRSVTDDHDHYQFEGDGSPDHNAHGRRLSLSAPPSRAG